MNIKIYIVTTYLYQSTTQLLEQERSTARCCSSFTGLSLIVLHGCETSLLIQRIHITYYELCCL